MSHQSTPIPSTPEATPEAIRYKQDLSTTDWFNTIPATHDQLYAPGLRTELSQRIWDEIPALLEENSEALQKLVGSNELSVFMHGSSALGVASEGGEKVKDLKLHPDDDGYRTIQPSDIDLLVVTGSQEEGIDNGWVGVDFGEASDFEEHMGRRPDITVINLPDMLKKIKDFDNALDAKAWPDDAHKILVKTGLILASPAMYQTNEGNTANIRNRLLKTILELSHSQGVWGELRRLFHEFTVDYEEGAWYPHPHQVAFKQKRSIRVNTAFDQVLARRSIPPEHHERAKTFMRARRSAIDLPTYEQIIALKEQIISTEQAD